MRGHSFRSRARAFFRLLIEREEPKQVAVELGVERALLLQSARGALERLLSAHEAGGA